MARTTRSILSPQYDSEGGALAYFAVFYEDRAVVVFFYDSAGKGKA